MNDNIKVKGEWYFEFENGSIEGPFSNFITTAGLAKIAELLSGASAPFLVVGDDMADGETINEIFRKPVSAVTRSGALIRYRTQLLTSECNGDHQKVSIYLEAAENAGTGIMLNLLKQPWSKAGNTTLTVECRITIQGVN
ncbi:MAG: hypothetical protein VB084_06435 [Syntrophomonadaceae bacterium]|nr:hypothetical protein [Syntrophomonadaceae bacterium]